MENWNKGIKLKDNIVKKTNGTEAVLLDLEQEIYHGLNATGLDMLDIIIESSSIEDGYQALVKRYDADPQVIKVDVNNLLETLTEKKIIEWGE